MTSENKWSGTVANCDEGATPMAAAKQFDFLNRLLAISNLPFAGPALGFNYANNSANQRTSVTNSDGSYWVYQYDNLGQVIAGIKHWSDGTVVAGQQFDYTFDDIGNRTVAASGGDQWGANLRYQNYTANSLNQYTSRTVPGYVQTLGTAISNATVTVWGQGGLFAQAARHGSYFRDELPVGNNGAAQWLSLTNFAVLQNGTNADIMTNAIGSVFLPQTPESFAYDADGNLTQDGRWHYYWDGENRLTSMAARTSAGPQTSLKFDYDWKSRRIRKQVWANTTWTGSATNDQRFAYDGWNLAGILTSSFALQTSFAWGLDLSGSLEGAGGAGGLLFIGNWSLAIGYYAAAYDGNGNVAALTGAADGTAAAQYEYGPFGEILRATGPLANANPFRFSSKFQDVETDLLYYGHRYYNPGTGRWMSKDPMEEHSGEPNLYVLVGNRPLLEIDRLGLMRWAEVEAYAQALDKALQSVKCCCDKPTRFVFDITGSTARTTVTGHAWPEFCGCINTVDWVWWDCYQAYYEGGNNSRAQGWQWGGSDFSDTQAPSANASPRWDPYHIAMEAAAVITFCRYGHMHAILWGSAHGLEWAWDERINSWVGPIQENHQ
jgi:RHS repeat-associated protein